MSMLSIDPGVTLPYVSGSDTSHAAAVALAPRASAMRQLIRSYVATQPHGATCDEVEVALSMRHQTASARIRELAQEGSLSDTGDRRPTRSGAAARIYRAGVRA
jgi:hypothetical protein